MQGTMSAEVSNSSARRLIARARGGDGEALEELLVRNRGRLEQAARASLGEKLRAHLRPSDVLQSTYVDILTSVPQFRGTTEEEFTAWVVRVISNNARDKARYFSAARRDRGVESSGEGHVAPPLENPLPSPSQDVAWSEELTLIGRAMRRLKEEHFRILCLHMRPGQQHEETARAMGRSVGASRVMLARARAALLLEISHLKSESSGG